MSNLLPNFNTPAVVNGVVANQSELGIAALEPRVDAEGEIELGGNATSGDVLYAKVTNPALGNFTENGSNSVQVSVTAGGGDTLATLAEKIAQLFSESEALQKLGFDAESDDETILFTHEGPMGNLTVVEVWGLGASPITATITGSAHVGDRIWLKIKSERLDAPVLVHYDVANADDNTAMAVGLKNAINNNELLESIGVSATNSSGILTLVYTSAAEVVLVEKFITGESIVVGGTITANDKLNVVINNTNLPGGKQTITYTVLNTDTVALAATALAAAITANANLLALGISAFSPSSGRISIVVPPAAGSTTFSSWIAGTEIAALGGTLTEDDVVTITVTNAALPGGHKDVEYTVVSGDSTLTLLATHIAEAIHNDEDLAELGIDATGSGSNVLITVPQAAGATSFSKTLSVDATVTVTLSGPGTETLTLAGTSALVALAHQETETFTPSEEILSGGSGPVIPLDDCNFVYNGQVVQLRENRRLQLGADALSALAAQGIPPIK